MSSKFYDELAALDRGIANRWKARSRDNPKYELKLKDMEAILEPLLFNNPSKKITDNQIKAIAKLVTEVEWTLEAGLAAQTYVQLAVKYGFMARGGQVLVTPDELRDVTNALGMGMTGKIAFKSPRTNFSYVPGHYQVILDLISKHEIIVTKVHMHGMEIFGDLKTEASYASDENRLATYQLNTPAKDAMFIVHEATHSIQDRADVSAKNKYIEADAYIAGVVADLAQRGKGTADLTGWVWTPAKEAAKLVLAGKASADDKAWTDAYDAVVKEVESDDDYKTSNEQMFDPKRKKEGKREKDQFDKILAELAKKTRTKQP